MELIKERVFGNKPSIALKKFVKGLLYSAGIGAIMYLITFVNSGGIPPKYAFLSGVVMAILQALKKGLEPYKPDLDQK